MNLTIELDNKMIITKDEWSLMYDLIHERVEMYDAKCMCGYVDNEKCNFCLCTEWIKDSE